MEGGREREKEREWQGGGGEREREVVSIRSASSWIIAVVFPGKMLLNHPWSCPSHLALLYLSSRPPLVALLHPLYHFLSPATSFSRVTRALLGYTQQGANRKTPVRASLPLWKRTEKQRSGGVTQERYRRVEAGVATRVRVVRLKYCC